MVNKEDYILRINQATPAGLVVINYELIVAFLHEALAVCEANTIPFERRDVFRTYIHKAKNGLLSLIQGLNLEITIAQDLFQIYEYVEKLLNGAYFGVNPVQAEEALDLMGMLLTAWEEAAKQETETTPITEHTPKVYAGLTYERGGLSEYVAQDESRGYKA